MWTNWKSIIKENAEILDTENAAEILDTVLGPLLSRRIKGKSEFQEQRASEVNETSH